MAAVQIREGRKVFRRHPHHPRRGHRHGGRAVHRAGRTVRLRQVHPAAHDRGAGGNHQGRNADRRARRQQHDAQGTRHRDGVPELRAVSAHDGAREHDVQPDAGAPAQGGRRRAGAQGRRHPGPERPARPLSAPAFGRPAPARGHGPLHRARSPGVPVRRAAVQPRRQAAGADAHRDQGTAPAPEDDFGLCHARPDRGHDHGRQDRGDARRHRRADRLAAGGVRPPGQPVRGRLHRLARDELPAGRAQALAAAMRGSSSPTASRCPCPPAPAARTGSR